MKPFRQFLLFIVSLVLIPGSYSYMKVKFGDSTANPTMLECESFMNQRQFYTINTFPEKQRPYTVQIYEFQQNTTLILGMKFKIEDDRDRIVKHTLANLLDLNFYNQSKIEIYFQNYKFCLQVKEELPICLTKYGDINTIEVRIEKEQISFLVQDGFRSTPIPLKLSPRATFLLALTDYPTLKDSQKTQEGRTFHAQFTQIRIGCSSNILPILPFIYPDANFKKSTTQLGSKDRGDEHDLSWSQFLQVHHDTTLILNIIYESLLIPSSSYECQVFSFRDMKSSQIIAKGILIRNELYVNGELMPFFKETGQVVLKIRKIRNSIVSQTREKLEETKIQLIGGDFDSKKNYGVFITMNNQISSVELRLYSEDPECRVQYSHTTTIPGIIDTEYKSFDSKGSAFEIREVNTGKKLIKYFGNIRGSKNEFYSFHKKEMQEFFTYDFKQFSTNCIPNTNCRKCKEGFQSIQLQNQAFTCEKICPDNHFSHSNKNLQKNNTIINCVNCSSLESSCLKCDFISGCIQCKDGYYLHNQLCYKSCPNGYLKNGQNCVKTCSIGQYKNFVLECKNCSLNCIKCKNINTCLMCTNDTILYQGKCYPKICSNRSSSGGGSSSNSEECPKCQQNCDQCRIQNHRLSCKKCKSTEYQLTFEEDCTIQCPKDAPYSFDCYGFSHIENHYPESQCYCKEECPKSSVMIRDSLQNRKYCSQHCPSHQVANYEKKVCVDCGDICISCVRLNQLKINNCQQCKHNLPIYKTQCVSSCPIGFAPFSIRIENVQYCFEQGIISFGCSNYSQFTQKCLSCMSLDDDSNLNFMLVDGSCQLISNLQDTDSKQHQSLKSMNALKIIDYQNTRFKDNQTQISHIRIINTFRCEIEDRKDNCITNSENSHKKCQQCLQGYFLSPSGCCFRNCPKAYYKDLKLSKCIKCPMEIDQIEAKSLQYHCLKINPKIFASQVKTNGTYSVTPYIQRLSIKMETTMNGQIIIRNEQLSEIFYIKCQNLPYSVDMVQEIKSQIQQKQLILLDFPCPLANISQKWDDNILKFQQNQYCYAFEPQTKICKYCSPFINGLVLQNNTCLCDPYSMPYFDISNFQCIKDCKSQGLKLINETKECVPECRVQSVKNRGVTYLFDIDGICVSECPQNYIITYDLYNQDQDIKCVHSNFSKGNFLQVQFGELSEEVASNSNCYTEFKGLIHCKYSYRYNQSKLEEVNMTYLFSDQSKQKMIESSFLPDDSNRYQLVLLSALTNFIGTQSPEIQERLIDFGHLIGVMCKKRSDLAFVINYVQNILVFKKRKLGIEKFIKDSSVKHLIDQIPVGIEKYHFYDEIQSQYNKSYRVNPAVVNYHNHHQRKTGCQTYIISANNGKQSSYLSFTFNLEILFKINLESNFDQPIRLLICQMDLLGFEKEYLAEHQYEQQEREFYLYRVQVQRLFKFDDDVNRNVYWNFSLNITTENYKIVEWKFGNGNQQWKRSNKLLFNSDEGKRDKETTFFVVSSNFELVQDRLWYWVGAILPICLCLMYSLIRKVKSNEEKLKEPYKEVKEEESEISMTTIVQVNEQKKKEKGEIKLED